MSVCAALACVDYFTDGLPCCLMISPMTVVCRLTNFFFLSVSLLSFFWFPSGLAFQFFFFALQQFFHGYHMAAVLPSTVPVDGRPSGEAYVQFTDANEAWRAYQHKQGAMMERRWIELFPTSKAEMDFAAAGGDPKAFRDGRAQPGGAMGGGGMPPY
eukprot:GHVT01095522.1.p1 GENE.GHVT01095522.1~~GHVT01095522.1.p1  ORF type:complete len:157 (-),score=31.81 GHVT01095522.1:942-1412(-)